MSLISFVRALSVFSSCMFGSAMRLSSERVVKVNTKDQPPAGYPACFPSTSKNAAKVLNRMYMNFNMSKDTSLLGVTISMLGNITDFMGNIWCQAITGVEACDIGHMADCRFSASLYNHEMLLAYNETTNKTEKAVAWAMDRSIGVVFNQHMVEGGLGRCAYTFDGATNNKWNGGCGRGGCNCTNGGYNGTCASGEMCSRESTDVLSGMCKTSSQPQGLADELQRSQSGPTCFYELPGLIYPEKSAPDHLREMVKARVEFQAAGLDPVSKLPLVSLWNEVVLDDRTLIPAMRKNASDAIWAFVYDDSSPQFEIGALALREGLCETFKCKTKPPLVAFTKGNFASQGGPFHESSMEVLEFETAETCSEP